MGVEPRRLPLTEGELQSDGGVWDESGMKFQKLLSGITYGILVRVTRKNLGREMLVDDEAVNAKSANVM